MQVFVDQGKREVDQEGTTKVPFRIIHKRRPLQGHIEFKKGHCHNAAAVIWQSAPPMVSEMRLDALTSNLIGAALGTDNNCRFLACPNRRLKRI